MPGFVPQVGDVLQIKTHCFFVDQISLNVMHYGVSAIVGGGLNLQEIADEFSDRVSLAYKDLMSPEAVYEGCSVQNMTPLMTVPYNSLLGRGLGIIGTKSAPSQTSFIIKLKSSLAGRRNIGHVYPGFPALNLVDTQGQITTPGKLNLAALALALGPNVLLNTGANSVQLLMLIRHPNVNVPVPGTPSGTSVYSIVPGGKWATQRRRGDLGALNRPFP